MANGEEADRRTPAIKFTVPKLGVNFEARGLGVIAALQFAALVVLCVLVFAHVYTSDRFDHDATLQRQAFAEALLGVGRALASLTDEQTKTTKANQETRDEVRDLIRATVSSEKERERIRIQMQSDALRRGK